MYVVSPKQQGSIFRKVFMAVGRHRGLFRIDKCQRSTASLPINIVLRRPIDRKMGRLVQQRTRLGVGSSEWRPPECLTEVYDAKDVRIDIGIDARKGAIAVVGVVAKRVCVDAAEMVRNQRGPLGSPGTEPLTVP